MVEEAPKRSSGSNGFVERAVQTCEGYIRSLKSQLDERYVVKIDIGHPIVTWLCEYASYLLNRLEVGRDGKTSYERMKGKRATVLGVEFGERIMWKEKPVGALRKMIPQWQLGIFLGVKLSSGEMILADDKGEIHWARTIRRVPMQTRWTIESLAWVRHTPWNTGANDLEAEGEATRFDFKAGPGVRMSPEDMETIRMKEDSSVTLALTGSNETSSDMVIPTDVLAAVRLFVE